ncbi:bifunctional alpha,alpha-trehalose-phosphate synthase (UDP-forming)/trehalose-phosphatase [Marinoscillum sp. 108]|uniref:bifunctional alpha,alpha-trehalose-phosphate synthase (UDP-forming)/trehalose-phosphatase n=1 Tax=Marinoscillum sp. 108 TaxID=2653151 RepID=UPI0012F2536B|nr:bifunctional alpha,alpha-trehalose-phosphate synthase (UDP-forming)/trehalose-phosphatase [Marinoscillum sp. 108]VXD12553.1 Alpha,alpha-trehalose-phosphate synthase (UDP-forming) / Trehalose-6-phosphate phosphatase [Marinoscillum sp. 108]
MAKTIIVSNRLPVKISQENGKYNYMPSEGGLATGLGSIYKDGDNIWIGWPGLAVSKADHQKEITKKLKTESMKPVFLTNTEIEEFYEGFSNETLWPNFHYFNQYIVFDDDMWRAYQKVNRKFARAIAEVLEPEDTIWVHDYQLLLLPEMLRESAPKASIGFFLHIPFPSYESFRLLPWRRELLEGMLGADFLGFHTYDDMRHFLSSVNRLAGLGNSNGMINVDNRKVMVDALPMGIDYDKYAESAAAKETLEREARYRESIGAQKLILSIDRLDYSKGIPQRLKAFELFLEQNPDYREKVSLLMVVVPSRDQVGKYKELKEEIDLLVGRINGNYSRLNWTPIHYFYRSFPLNALSAFYRMAEVAMVTPMRDGMNLVCKEFIASKLDKKGVLILSEMAGASKELSDAILINPNDMGELVNAIKTALTMPVKKQMANMISMQRSLQRYNIHHWVNLFMERLHHIKHEQKALETQLLDKTITSRLTKSYQAAKKRMIFLDYDGTLVGFDSDPLKTKPDKGLKTILAKLTADKKNRVVVISGRGRDTLEEWLSDFDLEIIAEHGVWIKERGKKFRTLTSLNDNWKGPIMKVLDGYVDRTPGSFVEKKDYSLVWHYRKVETGLGEARTRELTSHLKYITVDRNLKVLEGNKVVEIKNSEIDKGRAATVWLNKHPSDFVMACGDDWTDEDTFKVMPDSAYTIKVGTTSSAAKYRVTDFHDIRKLLKSLL